jgi:hypothetical protein
LVKIELMCLETALSVMTRVAAISRLDRPSVEELGRRLAAQREQAGQLGRGHPAAAASGGAGD